MVLRNDLLEQIFRRLDLRRRCRRSRINDGCSEHFSGLVHDCQLTSGTECRIPSEYNSSGDRRLHQELVQILSEYFDCTVFRFFRQFVSDLPFDRRRDQTLITVFHNIFQHRPCIWIVPPDHLFFEIPQDVFLRRFDLHRQELLFFPAVQCEDPVSCQFSDWFFKFIIHLIYGLCLRISPQK